MRSIILFSFSMVFALTARCQAILKGQGPKGVVLHYEGPLNQGDIQILREGIPVCTLSTRLNDNKLSEKIRNAEGELPLYPVLSQEDIRRIAESTKSCKNSEQLFLKYFLTVKTALNLACSFIEKGEPGSYKAYLGDNEIPVIADSSINALSELIISPNGSKSWYGHIETSWKIPDNSPLLFTRLFRKSLKEAEYFLVPDAGFRIASGDNSTLIIARDTSLPTLSWFNYKLVGLDFYGNASPLSESVQADNLDNSTLPLVLSFNALPDSANTQVILKWKLKFSERVKSIILERSSELNGNYERIADLSPFDSIYTDAAVNAMEATYYRLKIYDLKGLLDYTPVTPVINRVKPEALPPSLIEANLNPQSFPVIKWKTAGNHLRGYRVYRTSIVGAEPEQISGIIQSDSLEWYSFSDTSSLQSGTTYHYAVRSESKGYVLSDYSDFVSINLPDKFHESPVGLHCNRISDSTVFIAWNTSNPGSGGVYNIYKRSLPEGQWIKINEIPLFNINYFLDERAGDFLDWEFRVVSLNELNEEGVPSASVICKSRGGLQGLPLQCSIFENTIEIKWPELPDSNYFVLIEEASSTGEIINRREFPVLPSKTIWNTNSNGFSSFRATLKDKLGSPCIPGEWVTLTY